MRTALLFLLSIVHTFNLLAQNSTARYLHTIGKNPAFAYRDMTVDKENNLYVIDVTKDKQRILKFKDSELLSEFSIDSDLYETRSAPDLGPTEILVDDDFKVFLLNENLNTIEVHDAAGNYLKTLDPRRAYPYELFYPSELFFNSQYELYVYDRIHRKIFVFDRDGLFLKSITLDDQYAAYETNRVQITLDKADNIYVLESKINTASGVEFPVLQVLDPAGKFLREADKTALEIEIKASDLMHPGRMSVNSRGDIYLTNSTSRVSVLSASGELKQRFETPGSDHVLYSYWRPYCRMIFDNEDNLYLADINYGRHTLIKYNANHELIAQWGDTRIPNDIAMDKTNNVYFIDGYSAQIIKTDINGKELLAFGGKEAGLNLLLALTVDDQGYIYVLDKNYDKTALKKFDVQGRLVEMFADMPGFYQINFESGSTGLDVDHLGNIFITNWGGGAVYKYDPKGKLIFKIDKAGRGPGELWHVLDVCVDGAGNFYVTDTNGHRVQKFSSSGKFLFQFGSFKPDEPYYTSYGRITSDAFGNVLVSGSSLDNSFTILYNLKGEEVSKITSSVWGLTFSSDGNYFATADQNQYAIKIYELNNPVTYNIIQGNIYHDQNKDCSNTDNENGLADIILKAEPGPYYGISDAAGNYSVIVEKGTYKVTPETENQIGKHFNGICATGPNKAGVSFNSFGNLSAGNDFGADIALTPFLTTSVSSTSRRRCFENTTTITYANTGYAPSKNAKVYVRLPDEVELISAVKPYTRLPNGTYVFDVGTVAPGETKTITIQDLVTCGDESVRGLTVCTKAWISTEELPKGPVEAVTGACDPETGKVRFVIRNTTLEDMATGEAFRIYKDGELAIIEQYKLAAGDSLVMWVPALGKTVRVEAEQNGGKTQSSATIEGCNTPYSDVPISMGIVNQLPTDDEAPDAAEECLMITDSYDPNDKQVTPTGLTQENYTPTGTALKYKIRFQNTGTDVAYRVVVVDTLSDNLDISTLQMGSASHNYRFDVSGKGKPVLTWTFDNIMLPDSNSNEPGSHGYIQFSIKPKADLPEKTLVENFADIFFDFNSPVRTNITANRIYDMPEVISEADRLNADDIIATPGIISFTPASGKEGTEVIVSGKKFSPNPALNKLFFNGVAATIVSASETELKVIVPAGATSGNLQIHTNDGASQSTNGFEVYQLPVINSFSPVEGIAETTVTLQGKHLTEEWLQTITLGGQVCEIISKAGNSVVVKIPEGAVTGKFEAISKGGEAQTIDAFVVWHQPVISTLSKTLEKAGATIEITGINFAPVAARNKVWFNQTPAQVLAATTTSLQVTVPQGAQAGFVKVETPGGTAESPLEFELIPSPVVTDFSPVAGPVGAEVILTGQHFLTMGQDDIIMFNGEKALVLTATPTQVQVVVPRGATSGKITVVGAGGSTVTTSDFKIETLTPEQAIEVYPNPTTGNFTIRFTHADFEVQLVQLFSTLGQMIYSEKVNSPRPDKLDVTLSRPKAGIYILHIKTERGLVVKKLHVL